MQGIFLLDKIVNGTRGSLTLDLRRPHIPLSSSRPSLFTVGPPSTAPPPSGRGGRRGARNQFRARGRMSQHAQEERQQFIDNAILPNMSFGNTGARIKAMRHVQFGHEFTYKKHGRIITAPQFDFGAGVDFDFDTAELRPLLRLKFRDIASLQAAPYPAIRIHHRMQLGTSGFGVRVSYECPLEHISTFYAPPAKLLVNLEDMVETGLRITQSGIEINANESLLNGNLRVKAAGLLHLPSSLPVTEDEMLFRFEAKRLGFKTRW